MFFLLSSRTETIMYETAQFTSFEDWIAFGNFMSAFYRNLLCNGDDGELKIAWS